MTCVGRLPSPTPSPPSPISPMRLSSALFFFTLPTFRSPLQPVPTPFSLPLINLLGTPRPRRPGCLVYPSPPAVASCANLVQSPTNLFVVELFSMHAEELGNMTSAVSTGGGGERGWRVKESRFFFSPSSLYRVARFPMFIVDRVSLFDRPRLHRQGKWIG